MGYITQEYNTVPNSPRICWFHELTLFDICSLWAMLLDVHLSNFYLIYLSWFWSVACAASDQHIKLYNTWLNILWFVILMSLHILALMSFVTLLYYDETIFVKQIFWVCAKRYKKNTVRYSHSLGYKCSVYLHISLAEACWLKILLHIPVHAVWCGWKYYT